MINLLSKTLGLVFIIFGLSLLAPTGIAIATHDGTMNVYASLIAAAFTIGLPIMLIHGRSERPPRIRDGFLIVTLTWFEICILGALPFVLIGELDTVSALFESASGFTTTGSTTILELALLPQSLLFYRQEIQWIGGVGVVVLAIALIPMLGIGGMQVLKAETSGPAKSDKLQPRLQQTVQAIWRIYLALTVACAMMYWFAGMSPYDAIAHSLTTVSTGGFSTYDDSLAHFDKPAIEAIACIFMLLGSISFVLHSQVWAQKRVRAYLLNVEVAVFFGIIAVMSVVVATVLHSATDDSWVTSAHLAVFEVVSVITSTGFGITDFSVWPLMLPPLLIFVSFIGGCTGSTAGGMKVLRWVLMTRQMGVEVSRLIHPRIIRSLKIGRDVVSGDVIRSVWAFFMIYMMVFALLMLILMGFGLDQVTAFGAVATSMNNLGPGLGDVAMNFGTVGPAVKLICALACIMGRLEVFTVFVLCAPAYWREQPWRLRAEDLEQDPAPAHSVDFFPATVVTDLDHSPIAKEA